MNRKGDNQKGCLLSFILDIFLDDKFCINLCQLNDLRKI